MDFSEGVLGRQYCNKVRKPRYAIRFVDFIGLYHAGYSIIKQQQIFHQYSFRSLKVTGISKKFPTVSISCNYSSIIIKSYSKYIIYKKKLLSFFLILFISRNKKNIDKSDCFSEMSNVKSHLQFWLVEECGAVLRLVERCEHFT